MWKTREVRGPQCYLRAWGGISQGEQGGKTGDGAPEGQLLKELHGGGSEWQNPRIQLLSPRPTSTLRHEYWVYGEGLMRDFHKNRLGGRG